MFLLSGIGILHSEPLPRVEPVFEGVMKYELDVGGRKWAIQNTVKGPNSCTDVFLNDLKFQSVLKIENEVYLIDVLGKRIVPLSGRGRRGGAEREHFPEESPNGDDVSDIADENQSPRGPRPVPTVDPATPVGEGMAWEHPSLKFAFKEKKRKVELEGITGYPSFPFQVFEAFKDLRDMRAILASTLQHYQLTPVDLHVAKRKEFDEVRLKLISIEPTEVLDDVFEFPDGYAMKMGVPKGGGNKGHAKGGRGGPPPGGGRGGH